jgi:hypothetical protein
VQDEYSNNCDFADFSPGITYSKSQLDAPIIMPNYIGGVWAERSILSPLCIFMKTSPIN